MTLASVAGTARLALALPMLAILVGCVSFYGANFDYPDEVPVPESATVLATDKGWDDDDPMRSRQQIIDGGEARPAGLLDFYRQTYPAADGWTEVEVGRYQELCLINRSDDGFAELVEVYRYRGSRVEVRPGRHLVTISRFQRPGRRPCGLALAWIPVDLFTGASELQSGLVEGRLVFVGPAPGRRPVPLHSGMVKLHGAATASVKVDAAGRFRIRASPGVYEVTATSPEYRGGTAVCRAASPVRVSRMTLNSVTVVCPIK